jgi:hypothetical protein
VHAFIADPLRRPVSDAHADGGEVCFQWPFRSLGQVSIRQFALASTSCAPTERALARAARGATASGDGEDEFDVAWVDLLVTGMPTAQAGLRALKA